MKLEIQFIPHAQHRFTTIGHWFVKNDVLTIQISQEICWENKVLTLLHELIEAAICIRQGITTEQCDAFDALFEAEYALGIWPKSVEAGFDPRCPYGKGHVWGTRFERLACWAVGVSKKKLDAECNALMGVE